MHVSRLPQASAASAARDGRHANSRGHTDRAARWRNEATYRRERSPQGRSRRCPNEVPRISPKIKPALGLWHVGRRRRAACKRDGPRRLFSTREPVPVFRSQWLRGRGAAGGRATRGHRDRDHTRRLPSVGGQDHGRLRPGSHLVRVSSRRRFPADLPLAAQPNGEPLLNEFEQFDLRQSTNRRENVRWS